METNHNELLQRARAWADKNASRWVIELLNDTRPQLPAAFVRPGAHNPRTCDEFAESLARRMGWIS
jgi:hypothetical protein